MATPSISDLYTYYETLNNESSTPEQKEAAYRSILPGVKGGEQEKRLSSQFISRFSNRFENLKEESFNCILDLCDDEDVTIRKQAVHDLFQLCKRVSAFVPRVSDVLVQMFQTDDVGELQSISLVLTQLLHLDPKATLAGVFNQLLTINPDNPREHVMKFLAERIKYLPENKLTPEVEELIVEQANKVLRDVSEEEFPLLISILSSLKCMSTVPGRQKLVLMITEQALQACPEFNPADPACIAQIRESSKQAVICVSKNVHARELCLYMLRSVMPNILNIPENLAGDRLALLRIAAEFSNSHQLYLGSLSESDLDEFLTSTFRVLDHFLPEVPITQPADETVLGNSADQQTKTSEKPVFLSGLRLSELECLLCVCCLLGKLRTQYFGGYSSETERETRAVEDGTRRLRQIRPRLQYLSRVAHEYTQSIAEHVGRASQGNEEKTRLAAHSLVSNIQTLVRNFFHNPPTFKASVSLSWIQPPGALLPSHKRPSITTGIDGTSLTPNKVRREMPRYVPPVGQWSRNIGLTRQAIAGRFNHKTVGRACNRF